MSHLASSISRLPVGFLLVLFTGLMCVSADAADALVSPQWLVQNTTRENLRILDLQPSAGYARIHIAGSVNTEFGKWRQPKPKQGMALPNIRYLEEMIGALGITKDTHVVLAPIGVNASEIAIATRIYWTFKVLGHQDISILDGGLIAYSRLETAKWSDQQTPVAHTKYQATPDLSLAPTAMEIFTKLQSGASFVDYRSEAEFLGQTGGLRPGTIPNAKNLPFDWLVEPGKGGRYFSLGELAKIFQKQGISTDGEKEQIAFCNSGHRASLGWFVSHELLGNKRVKLYDGSMAEWTQYSEFPVSITNR